MEVLQLATLHRLSHLILLKALAVDMEATVQVILLQTSTKMALAMIFKASLTPSQSPAHCMADKAGKLVLICHKNPDRIILLLAWA